MLERSRRPVDQDLSTLQRQRGHFDQELVQESKEKELQVEAEPGAMMLYRTVENSVT